MICGYCGRDLLATAVSVIYARFEEGIGRRHGKPCCGSASCLSKAVKEVGSHFVSVIKDARSEPPE